MSFSRDLKQPILTNFIQARAYSQHLASLGHLPSVENGVNPGGNWIRRKEHHDDDPTAVPISDTPNTRNCGAIHTTDVYIPDSRMPRGSGDVSSRWRWRPWSMRQCGGQRRDPGACAHEPRVRELLLDLPRPCRALGAIDGGRFVSPPPCPDERSRTTPLEGACCVTHGRPHNWMLDERLPISIDHSQVYDVYYLDALLMAACERLGKCDGWMAMFSVVSGDLCHRSESAMARSQSHSPPTRWRSTMKP